MDDDRHIFPIQFLLDHIFALLIISILILIALKSFLPYHRMAELTGIAGGSPFLEMKLDMMLYRAHHGVWPKDNQQALGFGWTESYDKSYTRYIKRAEIDTGAINFFLGEDLEGKTVTLRPAVPAADPLGPVIWVCGDRESSSGWRTYGVDRTNVDDTYIHSSWR